MPTDLLFSLISVFFYLYYSWGFPFLLGIEVKRYKAMQLNEQSSFSNNLSSWVPDLTIIRTHFFSCETCRNVIKRIALLQFCT